jgi:threonine/homoserine/homoserine lactone efflux protein
MAGFQTFFLFLATALLAAITPGPASFISWRERLPAEERKDWASSVGLGLGGLVHVFGGAVGISALIMTSAEAFILLRIAGALYLIGLGSSGAIMCGLGPTLVFVRRSG